jgi:hypothetical protein
MATHAEAFALMTYRADDGSEEERIWNSRDGVTPFVVTLRSGKQATHVDWRSDVPDPAYRPQPGERVFVDLTPERALAKATARVDAWLAGPERGHLLEVYGSREQAIAQQAGQAEPGAPDLVEVTEQNAASFGGAA